MALFGNNRESQRMTAMRENQKPEEELEMLIEYYDKTTETISITSNLEELQQLVGNSLSSSRFKRGVYDTDCIHFRFLT